MRNLIATLSSLSDDANGICEAQSAAGAQDLTLNGALVSGGVATLGQAQIVTLTTVADETGVDFTITGTDADGRTISETIDGVNATTAVTTSYFKTVTGISTDGATTGNVTFGPVASNGALTKSLRVNSSQSDFGLGIFVDVVSGTLTYSAEYTYEQPEDTYTNSYSVDADWRTVDGLTALTTDDESNIAYPINAVRLKITSYTSGSATITVTQSR